MPRKLTRDEFIEKAKQVHNDKYNYSKVEYINNRTKICIICPEHGEFYQTPDSHLNRRGCPECKKIKLSEFQIKAKRKVFTTEQFIEKAIEIHGNKYDYSKVVYIDPYTEICIICPEHGEFYQTPDSHLNGHGCILCGFRSNAEKRTKSLNDVIHKSRLIHNNKYSYDKSVYNGCYEKMIVTCPVHGDFLVRPSDHINNKSGCPRCGTMLSISEDEIVSFLKEELKITNVLQRERSVISPLELDIYLPDYRLAIEYNGLIWHSEKFDKNKYYHINKLNLCNDKGIKLIQIFEDEYNEHKEIILSKIKHILNKDRNLSKVYARKCEIKEIDKHLASTFLNRNHIQGFARSSVYIGAYYDGILVSVMSFKKEKGNKWELTRFATDITKHCIGIGGKLFSYFVKNYNPSEVKSFADRRWTLNEENNLYTKIGFRLDSILKPDYRYTRGGKRVHKFNCRKQFLIKKYPKYNLTMDMTESEMTKKIGLYKVWDCGLYKYIWKKN